MHESTQLDSINNTVGSIGNTSSILQQKYSGYYPCQMDLKRRIGKKIADARKARGWDQFQLAERCGFFNKEGEPAQGRVSHYETGRSPLSMELFEAIALALDLSPDELWNFGTPNINADTLTGAEAGIVAEFRSFDANSKQDLIDEIEQIKKRIIRHNGTKPGLASQKSAKRNLPN